MRRARRLAPVGTAGALKAVIAFIAVISAASARFAWPSTNVALTSMGVPMGVCRRALATRLAMAWRRWSRSPATTTGRGALSVR